MEDDETSPLTYSTQVTASADNTQPATDGRKSRITVEPVIFFMMLAYSLFIPLRLQYLTRRIARDEFGIVDYNHADDPLCTQDVNNSVMTVNGTTEMEIEQRVSLFALYLSATTSVPALFCTTLLGAHSDQAGRKVALIVPSIGFCVYAACYLTVTIKEMNIWYLAIGHFMLGVCGDFSLLLAGCFSYMADITTKKERALRIILLDCLSFTAAGIAQVGVGFWIKTQGFEAPYIFILGCVSLTTIYVIFLVPDTHPQAHPAMINVGDAIRKILNLVQSNTHQRRLPLFIATSVMLLRVLVFFSLPSLTLLYGMGHPFCWDSVIIGIFSAMQYVSGAIGMIIGGKLLSRYLRDASLVQVGLISSILCIVLTGVAPSNPYLYAVPVVGLFRALSLPMLRTIMSKLVYPSEQGVMFACIGCLQSLAMVVSPLIFNTLYNATLHILRGLVFYVMAAFLVIASLLSIVLQVKRQESSFLLLSDPSTINPGSRSLLTGRPRNYRSVPT
ncbi:proton-coupled folate transporter-like [Lytechinus variegatus]|uniref:proton-coupled folate transporter-like n=1 Tax=Lytechinus variegatus TaxID=7654 RepID=UPI001BB0FAE7|nr:proton-coupled folate transporter-like [Lytechinus variegatus]